MNKKIKKQSTSSRKNEAFGVILIGLGLVLLLSILSFSQTDNPQLKIENNSIKIKNLLGPTGAAIAQPLMNYTLGYPIIVLPVIIILIGYRIYRKYSLTKNFRHIVFLILWAFLFSIFLALPEVFATYGNMRQYYPSGFMGGKAASFLILYLGKFGTILVLTIFSFALIISTIQLRISDFFLYISNGLSNVYTLVKNMINKWQRERNQKKKERARLKLEAKRIKEIKKENEKKKPEISTSEDQIEDQYQDSDQELIEEIKKREILNHTDEHLSIDNNQLDKTIGKDLSMQPDEEGELEQIDSKLMDFEVKEEAKIEEVDYDQLVRESVAKYEFPPIDLLESKPTDATGVTREELKSNADFLEAKLMDFDVKAKVVKVTAGPVITMYELQPDTGVKVRQIVSLADDLALAMEAKGMRIIAPIPGKAAIGIEIPNKNPQIVYLKPMIRSETFAQSKFILPIILGKTINGEVYCSDLTKMPHLLMAGATGSGKSVGINTLIASILYSVDPGKVKFVMVDPKKIELSLYKDLRDHFLIWRTDLDEEVITKANNAISMLNSLTLEMERRYDKLAHLGVRNIEEYNSRVRLGGPRVKDEKLQQIPYIILIVDELADMMMMAAKEVEVPIARLAQMSRAVGIHLVLATQRPSVDVITGVIKANFPARIAYMVTSRPDSKTILDMNGAEKLLGNGDMLYQPPGEPRPIRLQNPIITTDEVLRIIKHVRRQPKLPHYSLPQPSDGRADVFGNNNGSEDALYEKAKELVITSQQGSISYLQRRLKIGYSRAARLIDEMEEEGIVGPADGGKPRQVYHQPEDL
ncbi:DNA translocase FtsK 4TM domain-containing protein [Calditrichota bacterium]